MTTVIIVGSGPVGSFMAILCSLLGIQVIIYEKRETFTRNINLKLKGDFFEEVKEVLSRLGLSTQFFGRLGEHLRNQQNRILIKDLEERFTREAISLGAQYIMREVESFDELHTKHRNLNPIILDCTGRKSKLRPKEFGSDENNEVIVPLQHAIYINFKAQVKGHLSLYQVMKYVKNIKLTEVVVSNRKDKDGFSDITIPVFIKGELASVFDRKYPNINREPLNPFNSSNVPDSIFFPISSLLGNLIIDGCNINLNTVAVKKIEITCGYARRRSRCSPRYICLGDSAIHLAFFKSLQLGLKHALEFFIKLSMIHPGTSNQVVNSADIIKEFERENPHLNPINAIPTTARNVFLVVTKVVWYGCYSYCFTNRKTEKLTNFLGVNASQIAQVLDELNQNLSSWKYLLKDFEAKRNEDIRDKVNDNMLKNTVYEYTSWILDINGKSFIKISELVRAVNGQCSLYRKDFDFLFKCFKARREAVVTSTTHVQACIHTIDKLLSLSEIGRFSELKCVFEMKHLSNEEKIQLLSYIVKDKPKSKENTKALQQDSNNPNASSIFILALIKNEIAQIQNQPTTDSSELNNMELRESDGWVCFKDYW